MQAIDMDTDQVLQKSVDPNPGSQPRIGEAYFTTHDVWWNHNRKENARSHDVSEVGVKFPILGFYLSSASQWVAVMATPQTEKHTWALRVNLIWA